MDTVSGLSDPAQVLKLSPNPADNQVQICLPEWRGVPLELQLVDLQGKRIRNWRIQPYEGCALLLTADVPEGNYLLQVFDGKHLWASPLQIRR